MYDWLSSHTVFDCQALTQKVLNDCSCGSYQCSFTSMIANVATITLAYKCALYLSTASRSTFLSLELCSYHWCNLTLIVQTKLAFTERIYVYGSGFLLGRLGFII